jgi:hypothetical protein
MKHCDSRVVVVLRSTGSLKSLSYPELTISASVNQPLESGLMGDVAASCQPEGKEKPLGGRYASQHTPLRAI